MAGRFSFSVPERRNASDPWFRIGTLDVTTTMLVVLASVATMFIWATSETLWLNLVLDPDAIRSGEVWRLLTWPLANQPGIWEVLTIAIFWYFGREIEGLLGRTRFAVMLVLLAVIPGLVGTVLDVADFSLAAVELGVFLVFIAEYPYTRFFFGIPAWAIGAVIVGIQVLQYLGYDETERLIVLFATIAVAAFTARAMGLAQSLPWIPKIPLPGSSGGGGGRAKRKRKPARGSGGGAVIDGPWGASSRGGPAGGAPLPQPPRPADDPRDQVELDHLLDKISANGMDGLTADEKRRLNELSKRLRNRK